MDDAATLAGKIAGGLKGVGLSGMLYGAAHKDRVSLAQVRRTLGRSPCCNDPDSICHKKFWHCGYTLCHDCVHRAR